MKKSAFTLAEILIVLTIIGVMAVMTIPSLIQNSNSQQKIVLFKKAFNAVSNAYATEFATKTGVRTCTDRDKLWDALKNQLNVKYFYTTSGTAHAFEDTFSQNTFTKEYTDLSYHTVNWIVTEDGIAYNVLEVDCPTLLTKLNFNKGNKKRSNGGYIYTPTPIFIDINGMEKPNKICPYNISLDNLSSCDIMMVGVTSGGIAAGHPDCNFAGRVMSDNTTYDASKCN